MTREVGLLLPGGGGGYPVDDSLWGWGWSAGVGG